MMKIFKVKTVNPILAYALIGSMFIFSSQSCVNIKGLNSVADQLDTRMADAIHSMDNAIATLSQQSANWQVVIANLEKEISKDMQSTIRSEITDLTRNAVSSTGAEIRCNAEYMRIKIRRELIDMRNELAKTFNAALEKKSLKNFKVSLLEKETIRPFICDIVPSAVDMSMDDDRRLKVDIYGFDLRSFPITAVYKSIGVFKPKAATGKADFSLELSRRLQISELQQTTSNIFLKEDLSFSGFELLNPQRIFEHDISAAISIISDFHAVLDLTGSGANLPPNVKEILLTWDNKIQCEIPILIHEKVYQCITYDTTITISPITFIPAAVKNSEYGGHPDTEFAGFGPCINFNLFLYIDPSRKSINAAVFMDAWECKDDFSNVHDDYTQAIEIKTYQIVKLTEPNLVITGFNLEPNLNEMYIDTDIDVDIRNYGPTAPASKIEFTGDTYEDEAGNETGAHIVFNPITLKLQKCGYK